ncbi:hypothetical protein O181_067803 [Austropuccinia psidii MF-1]|uniref:Uncharacterized protein n=1 Tax=Austropuccinia psidii MF-1 TaxID=1389203 RepID=A0A9Q3EZF9_9BASI|nr:hypothetical protein [Austropuccinia psidii MF-1]
MNQRNQTTCSSLNENMIKNKVSGENISNNTEINSFNYTAYIPTSNWFSLIHNINKSDSCTRTQKPEFIAENNATSKVLNDEGPKIDSSKKTQVDTIKQSFKMNDGVNEDPKWKFTIGRNKSKAISSSRISISINQSTQAKFTADTTNSKRIVSKKKEMVDESKIKNEIQELIATRTIGKSTKLKKTILKALKNYNKNR